MTDEARYYKNDGTPDMEAYRRLEHDPAGSMFSSTDHAAIASELARLQRERDEARDRADAAERHALELLNGTLRLRGLDIDPNGEARLQMEHSPVIEAMAEHLGGLLDVAGAPNYVAMDIECNRPDGTRRRLSVIIQNRDGETPVMQLAAERAAREKAEHDCGLWQDTVVEYEDILRRCEGIFSFLHFTPENEPSWDDLPDMIMELRVRAETAESTLAGLRAELRQARRREQVMRAGVLPDPSHSDGRRWTLRIVSCWSHTDTRLAALNKTLYDQPFTSPEAALDAAWSALHDAGLVEDG